MLSQRQGNLFVLTATEVNVAGADFNGFMTTPAGFGDCKLYEASLFITGAGAMTALTGSQGLNVELRGAQDEMLDYVGVAQMFATSVSAAGAVLQLEVTRLWRANERLYFRFPDMESATTTGDVQTFALVQRLRDVGAVT